MQFKQLVLDAYTSDAYTRTLEIFIAEVKEYMLTSAGMGYKGVIYKETDIRCNVTDFESWLTQEHFVFYWKHSWFSERKLFIEFGL